MTQALEHLRDWIGREEVTDDVVRREDGSWLVDGSVGLERLKATLELDELPARIEALERAHAELVDTVSQPEFYKRDAAEQADTRARLAALPAQLEAAYARWESLEARR